MPALRPERGVGAYEVLAPLGNGGGKGEVYRARDTRLGREVALELLAPELASDSHRVARFRREAQVLATLNHPCIGAIHGGEDAPSGGGWRRSAPGSGAELPRCPAP